MDGMINNRVLKSKGLLEDRRAYPMQAYETADGKCVVIFAIAGENSIATCVGIRN